MVPEGPPLTIMGVSFCQTLIEKIMQHVHYFFCLSLRKLVMEALSEPQRKCEPSQTHV